MMVALNYAMRHPERVRGLVMFEGFFVPTKNALASQGPVVQVLMRLFKAKPFAEKVFVASGPSVVDKFMQMGTLWQLPPEVLETYREPLMDPEHRRKIWVEGVGPHTVRATSRHPGDIADSVNRYVANLAASNLPKLLLYATPGMAIKHAAVKYAKATFKNVQIRSIGPGKHFLPEDQPGAVGQAIADFALKLRKSVP